MRLVITLLAALLAAPPALACSCSCRGDAAELVRSVSLIFRGVPVAEATAGNVRRYTIEVTAVLKGEVQPRVEVRTPSSSAACGVVLEMGREALIAAHRSGEGPQTNLCTHYCLGQKLPEVERILARCKPGAPCPPED